MNMDDLAKLILFVSISISIVGISIQLMRMLSGLTDNIKDLRRTVKNVGKLTEGLVEDEKLLRRSMGKISKTVDIISNKIVRPLEVIFSFLTTVATFIEGVKSKFSRER
jgi:uncharacterized protein YoxC